MRGLRGKVAAVTGAGSGIGQAAAERLAEEGCRVAVLDWNGPSAETTVDHIRKAGGEAIAIATDVSDEAQVEAAFAKIVEHFGRLDILVSNAGIFSAERDGKVDALPKAVWDEIVGVNLTGMYLELQARRRRDQGDGGQGRGGADRVADRHVRMHAGQHRLWVEQGRRTRPVAGHGGRSRSGRHPRQRRGAGLHADADRARTGGGPEGLRMAGAEHSAEARRRADEIAGAVAFLASDDASYMTGSFMFVDGGLTAI